MCIKRALPERHYDVARKQLEAVHWQPKGWNLSGLGKDLSLMALEVAARTGRL